MSTAGLFASTLSIVTVSGGLGLQIHKIIRLRKASQLSLVWLSLGVFTWAGWVVYGLSIHDSYIAMPNIIGLIFQSSLLAVSFRFRAD